MQKTNIITANVEQYAYVQIEIVIKTFYFPGCDLHLRTLLQ